MKKRIHINRLGYMIGMPKAAVCISTSAGIFYLVDANQGISVYAGRLSHPSFDRDSGDNVRIADFSDYNVSGRYFIRAGYRRSDVFEISDDPYKKVRNDVLLGIYLNRCGYDFGSDKEASRIDRRYIHRICHTEKVSCGERTVDVSGGWHSTSGYGKNVLYSAAAAADMLYALKLFGESFSESERLMLEDECRWGLDWLLRMQDFDGGVYESYYSLQSGIFTRPDEDESKYLLSGKSCSAALRLTAAAALGAEYFAVIDEKYSHKLRRAAEKSWLWTVQSPEYGFYSSRNGGFSEDEEEAYILGSEFMWALCEMYALTGDASFGAMIGKKYLSSEFSGFGNGSCGGFAALSYLLSDRSRERNVEAFVRKKITDRADRMWIADRESGYRVSRSAGGGFGYSSNFRILSDCMEFITAYLISGEHNYLEGATDQFSYVFGRNPLSIAFMTGKGEEFCKSPCHSLSSSLEGGAAVPGMIVSGANTDRSDDYSKWHIERGTPPAKCYIDNEYSITTNEAAVHFSAPVIFISAFYDKVGRSALSGVRKQK